MSQYADYKDFIVTNTISEEEHYEYYLGESALFQSISSFDYFRRYGLEQYEPTNPVTKEDWEEIKQETLHLKYTLTTQKEISDTSYRVFDEDFENIKYTDEEQKFYVYLYLDPRKPGLWKAIGKTFLFEPFYVGKGHGRRMYSHLLGAKNKTENKTNSQKRNKIGAILKLALEPIILKLYEGMSERSAFSLETQFIRALGRTDLKTGPLLNKTDGGDGTSNIVCSSETKKLKSISSRKYYTTRSIEEAEKHRESLRLSSNHFMDNLSDEERLLHFEPVRSGIKLFYATASKEILEERSDKISRARKEYFRSITPEEKEKSSIRMSVSKKERHKNMTVEERERYTVARRRGARNRWDNITEEALADLSKSASIGQRKRFDNMNKSQYAQHVISNKIAGLTRALNRTIRKGTYTKELQEEYDNVVKELKIEQKGISNDTII